MPSILRKERGRVTDRFSTVSTFSNDVACTWFAVGHAARDLVQLVMQVASVFEVMGTVIGSQIVT